MTMLKAAGLGIAMVLGVAATLVCGILVFVDLGPGDPKPPTWVLVGGALFGMVVAAICLRGMIALSNRWKERFRASFEQEEDQLLAYWKVPSEIWRDFASRELQGSREGRLVASAAVGIVLALLFMFATWSFLGVSTILLSAAGILLAMTLTVYLVDKYRKEREYLWRRNQQDVDVWLRPDGMRVNDRIQVWDVFNSQLLDAKLKEPPEGASYNIFEARVRIEGGRQTIHRTYRAPVPSDAQSQVSRGVESLRGT